MRNPGEIFKARPLARHLSGLGRLESVAHKSTEHYEPMHLCSDPVSENEVESSPVKVVTAIKKQAKLPFAPKPPRVPKAQPENKTSTFPMYLYEYTRLLYIVHTHTRKRRNYPQNRLIFPSLKTHSLQFIPDSTLRSALTIALLKKQVSKVNHYLNRSYLAHPQKYVVSCLFLIPSLLRI
jgi:hypothetical protein